MGEHADCMGGRIALICIPVGAVQQVPEVSAWRCWRMVDGHQLRDLLVVSAEMQRPLLLERIDGAPLPVTISGSHFIRAAHQSQPGEIAAS